jgi:hypothetical protein
MQHGTVKRMGIRWGSSNNTGSSSSGAVSGNDLRNNADQIVCFAGESAGTGDFLQRNCILKESN